MSEIAKVMNETSVTNFGNAPLLSDVFTEYFSFVPVGNQIVLSYPPPELAYQKISSWNVNNPPFTLNDMLLDAILWKTSSTAKLVNIYSTLAFVKYKTKTGHLTAMPGKGSEPFSDADVKFCAAFCQSILNAFATVHTADAFYFRSRMFKKYGLPLDISLKKNDGKMTDHLKSKLVGIETDMIDAKGLFFFSLLDMFKCGEIQDYPENLEDRHLAFKMFTWSLVCYMDDLPIPEDSPVHDMPFMLQPVPSVRSMREQKENEEQRLSDL